jgi:hypothetical protein
VNNPTPNSQISALTESKPATVTNPTAWTATATVTSTNPGAGSVTAYVICA